MLLQTLAELMYCHFEAHLLNPVIIIRSQWSNFCSLLRM